jgi:hypothetical protein
LQTFHKFFLRCYSQYFHMARCVRCFSSKAYVQFFEICCLRRERSVLLSIVLKRPSPFRAFCKFCLKDNWKVVKWVRNHGEFDRDIVEIFRGFMEGLEGFMEVFSASF